MQVHADGEDRLRTAVYISFETQQKYEFMRAFLLVRGSIRNMPFEGKASQMYAPASLFISQHKSSIRQTNHKITYIQGDEMERLNEKYGRITFGFLLLSMISFPPMIFYMIYKMIRNTNIDYMDNYLSIKKCAKCYIWVPAIYTILCLISGFKDFLYYFDTVIFIWCFYGIFAFIFFRRAKKMKDYNDYFENLYSMETAEYENLVPVDNDYSVDAAVEYKIVICKSCGAKKQIVKGRKVKCDYCDSPLEVEL